MDRDQILRSLPDGRLLIGGDRVEAAAGGRLAVEDPARGEVVHEVHEAGEEDVARAVEAAETAWRGVWGAMEPRDRGLHLRRLARMVQDDAEVLAGLESLDVGKPLEEARGIDLSQAVDALNYFAGLADKLEGRTLPVRGSAAIHAFTRREAVGVVAAIIPWNFPLLMAAWKLAPALAAGCCVLLKPAEQTPLSALRLAELVREAGFPPGVVAVLPGRGEVSGRALVDHAGVRKIAFTGSTAVGKEIVHRSAGRLARVSLELGGKSAALVFADVPDLRRAAGRVAAGVFYNAGQCCTAGARVLVEQSIHDDFVALLVERANATTTGDPLLRQTRMGPLVSRARREAVLGFIERGTAAGARCLAGGAPAEVPGLEGGHFVAPTVFTAVSPTSELAREEVFGPVLAVTPFADEDEAVALANASHYGLAAGVHTGDLRRGHRLARRLEAGTVWVNTWNRFDASAPFGGVKESGYGRENGIEALDAYTATKTVWIDLR